MLIGKKCSYGKRIDGAFTITNGTITHVGTTSFVGNSGLAIREFSAAVLLENGSIDTVSLDRLTIYSFSKQNDIQ